MSRLLARSSGERVRSLREIPRQLLPRLPPWDRSPIRQEALPRARGRLPPCPTRPDRRGRQAPAGGMTVREAVLMSLALGPRSDPSIHRAVHRLGLPISPARARTVRSELVRVGQIERIGKVGGFSVWALSQNASLAQTNCNWGPGRGQVRGKCAGCGRAILGQRRPQARTCSARCRMAVCRARKASGQARLG